MPSPQMPAHSDSDDPSLLHLYPHSILHLLLHPSYDQ
jgi:hypothetical protein